MKFDYSKKTLLFQDQRSHTSTQLHIHIPGD